MHPKIRQLWQRNDGITLVEFALVAPLFFFIFLVIIEYGLFTFHRVILESVVTQAGREASLGKTSGGPCAASSERLEYVQCLIRYKAGSLMHSERIVIQVNTLANGGTFLPDICLDGNATNSTALTCRQYEEVNGTPGYQPAKTARADNNVGEAGEMVEVRVIYPWRVVVPYVVNFLLGQMETSSHNNPYVVMISSSTVVRNEPF